MISFFSSYTYNSGYDANAGSYTVTIDCNSSCPPEFQSINLAPPTPPPPTPPPSSPPTPPPSPPPTPAPTQAPGKYFSVSTVNVWRQPRALSSNPTSNYCGDSVVAGKE